MEDKKTIIDLEALKNLATSWRGSNGNITIQKEQAKFLKLEPSKEKTKSESTVFVNSAQFVKAVDREVVKVMGEPEEPKGDSEGPPKEPSTKDSEGSPKSKKKK